MEPGDSVDRHTMLNLFAFFVESLFLYADYIRRQTNFLTEQFMENIRLPGVFERVGDEVAQNQAIKFICFVVALSCGIPVVMFIMFGITSVIITFGGFLFIEGALLAFGGLCMVACIATLILVLSVLALTAGIFYVIALKLGYVIKNFEPTSNILRAISPSIDKGHLVETRHSHQN